MRDHTTIPMPYLGEATLMAHGNGSYTLSYGPGAVSTIVHLDDQALDAIQQAREVLLKPDCGACQDTGVIVETEPTGDGPITHSWPCTAPGCAAGRDAELRELADLNPEWETPVRDNWPDQKD